LKNALVMERLRHLNEFSGPSTRYLCLDFKLTVGLSNGDMRVLKLATNLRMLVPQHKPQQLVGEQPECVTYLKESRLSTLLFDS